MTRVIESSRYLYLVYRYGFLLMAIVFAVGIVKDGINEMNIFAIDAFFIFIFLAFFLVGLRKLFIAKLDIRGVDLGGQHFVKWQDIDKIYRFYHLYFLKKKDSSEFYLFPVENFSINLLGSETEADNMDQLIRKMMDG